MVTTSTLLKELLERGWTQSMIARRTGIPQPRLSKWARGQTPSGAEDALRLQALHREAVASKQADEVRDAA